MQSTRGQTQGTTGAGAAVIEMGTGSGAFTILLAQFTGKTGRICAFDRRHDMIENARKHLTRAGLHHRWALTINTSWDSHRRFRAGHNGGLQID